MPGTFKQLNSQYQYYTNREAVHLSDVSMWRSPEMSEGKSCRQ